MTDPHQAQLRAFLEMAPERPVRDDTPPEYAAAWLAHVGTEWKHTDGVSAVRDMQAMPRNKQPTWSLIDRNRMIFWDPPGMIFDLKWDRKNRPRGQLYRWDMRSAYLAAMAQAQLPYGRLSPDGGQYGYFRVRVAERHAYPGEGVSLWQRYTRPDRHGCIWVTSEARSIDQELCLYEVVESWGTDNAGRILRSWAERWRDLAAAAPEDLRAHLKLAYAQAVGLMGAKSGGIYRPDWRHLIIDRVRAMMVRRIKAVCQQTLLLPKRIDVDSVWYEVVPEPHRSAASIVERINAAIGVGDHIGQMRFEGIDA